MTHIYVSNRTLPAGVVGHGGGRVPRPSQRRGRQRRCARRAGAALGLGRLRGDRLLVPSRCDPRSFYGEWFKSGDMYVESEDGFYTYLGRADDMFKVGGEWVAWPRSRRC